MAVYTSVEGILTEKYEKTFDNGTKGYGCTILKADGDFLFFWCPEHLGKYIGEPENLEDWNENLCRRWRLEVKCFNGKKKYSFAEPKVL